MIEDLENHMVLPHADPGEGTSTTVDEDRECDELRERIIRREPIDESAALRARVRMTLNHFSQTNWLDKQELVQLLKDVCKELDAYAKARQTVPAFLKNQAD